MRAPFRLSSVPPPSDLHARALDLEGTHPADRSRVHRRAGSQGLRRGRHHAPGQRHRPRPRGRADVDRRSPAIQVVDGVPGQGTDARPRPSLRRDGRHRAAPRGELRAARPRRVDPCRGGRHRATPIRCSCRSGPTRACTKTCRPSGSRQGPRVGRHAVGAARVRLSRLRGRGGRAGPVRLVVQRARFRQHLRGGCAARAVRAHRARPDVVLAGAAAVRGGRAQHAPARSTARSTALAAGCSTAAPLQGCGSRSGA